MISSVSAEAAAPAEFGFWVYALIVFRGIKDRLERIVVCHLRDRSVSNY